MKSPISLAIAFVVFAHAAAQQVLAQAPIYETNAFVETIAGSGFSGYLDGQGVSTMFQNPTRLVVDAATNVFAWDAGNSRIRKISADGIVTTFAGSGVGEGLTWHDGQGTNATFNYVLDMALDKTGDILVAGTYAIRRVTPSGTVTTWAGSFNSGNVDGNVSDARFSGIYGLAVDRVGNVFVSDLGNNRIRKIDTNGMVSTFAGSGNVGQQDGTGIFTSFSHPAAIAVDPVGNLFVADNAGRVVRRITPQAVVTTFLGRTEPGAANDGVGTNATFGAIDDIVIDSIGNLYVSDDGRVRKITPEGTVTTIAGGRGFLFADGEGMNARFYGPSGLALDVAGRIYLADEFNNRIRRIVYRPVPTAAFGIDMYAGLSIVGQIGRQYRIEFADGISNAPAWSHATVVTLTSSPFLWVDTDSNRHAKRFYRAVMLP